MHLSFTSRTFCSGMRRPQGPCGDPEGKSNWEPDPLFTTTVDGMDFVNNKYGIMDFGSDDATFTNNQFSTFQT